MCLHRHAERQVVIGRGLYRRIDSQVIGNSSTCSHSQLLGNTIFRLYELTPKWVALRRWQLFAHNVSQVSQREYGPLHHDPRDNRVRKNGPVPTDSQCEVRIGTAAIPIHPTGSSVKTQPEGKSIRNVLRRIVESRLA